MRLFLILSIFLFCSINYIFSQSHKLAFCELDSIDGQPIYLIVEESPEYKNGISQFYKDFNKNIRFSKIENSDFPDSKIYLSFVIDRKGKIRNLCFYPSTLNFDKNFINKLNKWKAGREREKKVNVRMLIPIRIRWK